jgi:chromosome segregation ATPase
MNFLRLLLFFQGFLKGMIFYLRFRETHEQVVAENETLRKKLDESQTKIRWLESKAEASQMMYECFRKEHGTTYRKFISAREEASHLDARLSDVTTELGACRSKVDALSQSLLAVKTKFRKAKDKLREYKTKAWSFYRQLSFASWGRDTGFYMGYLGGFETLKDWVRKP